MEQLQRAYSTWIGNVPTVLVISGVLLIGGILASGLQGVSVAEDLKAPVLLGNLIFGCFLSFLLIVMYIGWRFDNQPGRTIVVVLIATFIGNIINLLFPLALSGGWLPVWGGILLGIVIVIMYVSWRVGARFALVTAMMIIYTILVTAGLVLWIGPVLSAPLVFGLVGIGGYTFCMACVVCDRISTNIKNAKRDTWDQHIRGGMLQSIRPVLLWGAAAVLIALPGVIMGTGPVRSLAVLFLTGTIVNVYAILAFPAPLLLATKGMTVPQDTDRSSRRESRRRR